MSTPVTSDDRGLYDRRAVDDPKRVLEDRATDSGRTTLDDERVLQQGRAAVVKRLLRDRLNYDMWLLLKWNAGSQLGRTREHYDRFSWVVDLYGHLRIEALEQLQEDMRRTDAIITDVDDDIHRIIEARNVVPPTEIEWIVDRVQVAEQAHSLLIQTNDAIDILVRLRLLRRIRSYSSLHIARLAKRLQERLAPLQESLEQAKKDRTRSEVKAALNAAITVTTWMIPKLGLLARGGLYLGQVVMNEVLGDRRGATLAAASGAADLYSKLEELEDAHRWKQSIPKVGGGVIDVIGFGFDVREIHASGEEIERIERLLDRAIAASDQLLSRIDDAKRILAAVEASVPQVEAELVKENIDVGSTRRELDAMMEDINYAP